MKILKAIKDGNVIVPYVEDAASFVRRFFGLMYRKALPSQHGLLLTPCNEIHTFGMRFDIDAVTLSKDNKVLFIDNSVKPNKVRKKIKDGYMVLELNSGDAKRLGICIGDIIAFEQA